MEIFVAIYILVAGGVYADGLQGCDPPPRVVTKEECEKLALARGLMWPVVMYETVKGR